jgi:hypothetical protein
MVYLHPVFHKHTRVQLEDIAGRCQQYCTAHSDMAARRPGTGQVVVHVMV